MPDASKTKEQIKQAIQDAFAGTSYPGDGNLTTHKPGFDCDDCDELRADFKGRQWHEVPLVVIQWHYAEISLFSPEGFRYYLPAYMLASLDPADSEHDQSIQDSVLHRLSKPDPLRKPDLTGWFYKRICGFTGEQQAVIKSFLAYLQDNHDAYVQENDIKRVLGTLNEVWEECGSKIVETASSKSKNNWAAARKRN